MKAFFAGSFDPFTIGHRSIVDRCLSMFDSVVVAIGFNEHKRGEWDTETRVSAITRLYSDNPRVDVTTYSGLTVDAARRCGADILVRGVRSTSDFDYERNLADINREIGGMETVVLIALPELGFISSSMVRELLHNGHDVKPYIAGDFPLPENNGRHNQK